MTGTETEIKAGSFGNIKDLLRKANGTDTDSGSWRRSLRGRVGGESPPAEKATDLTITNEKTKKEATEQAAQAEQSEQPTQTQTAAAPAPSKTHKEEQSQKPVKEKPTSKPKSGYKGFLQRVNDFDTRKVKGSRHWLYLSDEAFSILNLAYGEKKLSAVLNTLADDHIRDCREDMKRNVTGKSGLFSE